MQLLSMIGKTPVVICHSSQRLSTHIHTQSVREQKETHFSYDVDTDLLIMVVLILHISKHFKTNVYELFVIILWLSIRNGKDILLTLPFCFCRWRC